HRSGDGLDFHVVVADRFAEAEGGCARYRAARSKAVHRLASSSGTNTSRTFGSHSISALTFRSRGTSSSPGHPTTVDMSRTPSSKSTSTTLWGPPFSTG